MNETYLKSILACPKCKSKLRHKKSGRYCIKCRLTYQKHSRIWHLLYTNKKNTKNSQKEYDIMHKKYFGGPKDGSYEILASIAKGNKTVDIACGEGIIERLAPETVGVECSLNALKKAKKKGAKYLVLADAHTLPFKDNSFDVSISTGSLEHFENPQLAINEMARVSKIQVLTVHKHPPIPFASFFHEVTSKLMGIKHQPIERPISLNRLTKMLQSANLKTIFKGEWALPFNYGRVIRILPEIRTIPSCTFIISIKK